jgi:hypothetical protein
MKIPTNDYSNSRPNDLSIWATDKGFIKATNQIYYEIKKNLGDPAKRYEKIYKRNLRVALLNLFLNYRIDPLRYVAFSRNENNPAYKKTIYNKNKVSSKIIQIFDALRDCDYLDDFKCGFYNRETLKGLNSRIRGNKNLYGKLIATQININSIYHKKNEIILRAKKLEDEERGKEIVYPESQNIKNMRSNIKKLNKYLGKFDVSLEIPNFLKKSLERRLSYPVDFTRKDFFRVFNDSVFNRGGRFYGHWVQNVPKKYRSKIEINGERVCELDYNGMHLRMLYSKDGIDLDMVNPYRIMGLYPKDKPLSKIVMQCIINAENRHAALKGAFKKAEEEGIYCTYGIITDRSIWLSEKHKIINKYFYTGIGSELQFIDSCIAEDILIEMLNQDIACIPIHDSFIVTEKNEDKLRSAMEKAYKKHIGFEPKIDKKY